jgi:acyl carrier protein
LRTGREVVQAAAFNNSVPAGFGGLILRLMSETIQDRVLRVIATTKRIPRENVRPDSTFEELGVDSLDRLNILFDLESEFDIEINDEDAKRVSNIHEMVEGITQLLAAKSAPAGSLEAVSWPVNSGGTGGEPQAAPASPLPSGAPAVPPTEEKD